MFNRKHLVTWDIHRKKRELNNPHGIYQSKYSNTYLASDFRYVFGSCRCRYRVWPKLRH